MRSPASAPLQAPEVVSHQRYDAKCDVFSYGVLLWEMATGGAVPYAGFTPLQAAVGVVQKGLRPTVPEGAHPALARIMARCWEANPAARPDFGAIIALLEALPAEKERSGGSGSGDGAGGGGEKGADGKPGGGFFARMRRCAEAARSLEPSCHRMWFACARARACAGAWACSLTLRLPRPCVPRPCVSRVQALVMLAGLGVRPAARVAGRARGRDSMARPWRASCC
jgi:hypothetical protein